MDSFTPGMVIIDIVNKELTELMGGSQAKLAKSNKPPTVIMMAGLQGAGKTTTSGKLAKPSEAEQPTVAVAGDIYRPAAIKQLEVLGSQINVPVFSLETRQARLKSQNRASSMPKITVTIMSLSIPPAVFMSMKS